MTNNTSIFLPRLLGAQLLSTLLLATTAAPALAQSQAAPAEEPSTQVISDSLRYDDNKRESTFTGNVVATRGQMVINSDQLVVSEDKAGNQFGTATANKGRLVTIVQNRPETFERIEGKGLRAEYDGAKSQFDLIGQAVVTRFICDKPYDTIRGERVRYYQKSDVYEAQGGPNSSAAGGRVRSLAEPRAKTQAAIDACRAAQGTAKHAPAAKK
jgi:lipopolysaccharide export system protein LptA